MTTQLAHLPINEVLLRIGLALVAGLTLGFEREQRGRAAGLRTTMLTCMASCLAMLLSHYFAVEYASPQDGPWRPDPGRLAAGILTGIGFLGAGTIVRQNGQVRGLTTAAVLWYATMLGLIFGSGYHALGLLGLLFALFALFLLPHLEEHIASTQYAVVSITMGFGGEVETSMRRHIEEQGVHIEKTFIDIDMTLQQQTVHYSLRFVKHDDSEVPLHVAQAISQAEGVLRVRWE